MVQESLYTRRRHRYSVTLPRLGLVAIRVVVSALDHHARKAIPNPGALYFEAYDALLPYDGVILFTRLHYRVA